MTNHDEWTTVTHKKKNSKSRKKIETEIISSHKHDNFTTEISFPSPSHYKSKVTYDDF